MKAKRVTYTIIIIILISVARSYGQTDSARRKAVTYLSGYLKADTGTAGKVLAIQEAYKQAVKQVISNNALTEQQRRSAIDALMDVKNGKLQQLLPPRQLNLLVPTTERRRNWQPDTTANKTH